MQVQPETVRTPTPTSDEAETRVFRPTLTHEVEVDETDDGQIEVTVPISSTTEHRSGGVMTELALESMVDQLEAGTVGLWDDHGLDENGWPEYRREDMYGYWVGGYIEDETLYATARLRDGDARSDDLADQLEQGLPIGFSVGYIALQDEWIEREDGEVREIIKVDLMECSPVGIPDNKDAYANAGLEVANALREKGVQIDRETASILADGVADTIETMTGTETNEADEDEEEQNQENRQSAEEGALAALDIIQSHMDDAKDEIDDWIDENGDGDSDEESHEGGSDEDDDEDASGDDDDDEETNSAELEEIRSEMEDLRSENEELEAKVGRIESENRESEGRSGIVTGDDGPGETDDEEPDETNTSAPRNALEEAKLLGGN